MPRHPRGRAMRQNRHKQYSTRGPARAGWLVPPAGGRSLCPDGGWGPPTPVCLLGIKQIGKKYPKERELPWQYCTVESPHVCGARQFKPVLLKYINPVKIS